MISTIIFLLITAAGFAASLMLGSKKKKEEINKQKGCFAVEYPKRQLAVAAILEVIGVCGNYYIMNDKSINSENKIFIQSLAFLVILAVIIIYICFRTNRFRILVEEDNITVYPAFGAFYTCTMEDIVSVHRKGTNGVSRKEYIDIKFKNGQFLHVVSLMSSYNIFLAKLSGYTIK